ncbi:uncharacterized protein PpBr36_11475 [Pyricularia pennisetigena]|nr:uncharacterized protein PpBr36_11475 [Pyricularia pennisetigena]TLS20248.1 hypothetical protein PpBr36_11475 [Pyricularia pennisetigena]
MDWESDHEFGDEGEIESCKPEANALELSHRIVLRGLNIHQIPIYFNDLELDIHFDVQWQSKNSVTLIFETTENAAKAFNLLSSDAGCKYALLIPMIGDQLTGFAGPVVEQGTCTIKVGMMGLKEGWVVAVAGVEAEGGMAEDASFDAAASEIRQLWTMQEEQRFLPRPVACLALVEKIELVEEHAGITYVRKNGQLIDD